MNPNEQVNVETPNDTAQTETADTTEDVAVDTVDETEEVLRLRKENETLKAQKDHWKTKATKVAEKPAESKETSSDLSQKDLLALMNAKVNEQDVDEIVEYAKLKKMSVSEALKTSVVKTILSDNEEKRRVAQATTTGTARRASTKPTDESILDRASKGEVPEDVSSLVEARWNTKKKK